MQRRVLCLALDGGRHLGSLPSSFPSPLGRSFGHLRFTDQLGSRFLWSFDQDVAEGGCGGGERWLG